MFLLRGNSAKFSLTMQPSLATVIMFYQISQHAVGVKPQQMVQNLADKGNMTSTPPLSIC